MTHQNPSNANASPDPEKAPLAVGRRNFLAIGMGVVAGLALPQKAAWARSSVRFGSLEALTGADFPQPPIAELGSSTQPTLIYVDPILGSTTNPPAQNIAVGRYYRYVDSSGDEGAFSPTPSQPFRTGPTFRLKACDVSQNTLNLKLINRLPHGSPTHYPSTIPFPSTGSPGVLDRPNSFNHTNLHFHGLHVSPLSLGKNLQPVCGVDSKEAVLSSDDVLFELAPEGEECSTGEHQYCVVLPRFHAPGTHWYHPHKHGSTALHVVDGLAGALIIEDEEEFKFDCTNAEGDERACQNSNFQDVDESKKLIDKDLVWVLQEVINSNLITQIPVKKSDPKGAKYDVPTDQSVYDCGSSSKQFTVNGFYQPTLTMCNNEIHRWRFINATATPRGFIKLRLHKVNSNSSEYHPNADESMYLIAVDGISFFGKRPKPLKAIDLSPANRADFLIQLTKPGKYVLLKEEVKIRGGAFSFPSGGPQQVQVLANITVKDAQKDENCKQDVKSPDELSGGRVPLEIPFNLRIPGRAPEYLKPIADSELLKNPDGSIYCRPVAFNIDLEGKSQGCAAYNTQAAPTPRLFEVNNLSYIPKSQGGYISYEPTALSGSQKPQYNTGEFSYQENKYRKETVQVVKLGTCEEWILLNYTNLIHPFHIHVNPFQVVAMYNPNAGGTSTDPKLKEFNVNDGVWYDTIGIPPGRLDESGNLLEPGYVKIRNRFWDYWGEYVFHCHILNHEDLGMMQNVYVVNNGAGRGPCKQVRTSPTAGAVGSFIGSPGANALPPNCYPPSYWPQDLPNPSFPVFKCFDSQGKTLFPEQRGTECIGGKTCEA